MQASEPGAPRANVRVADDTMEPDLAPQTKMMRQEHDADMGAHVEYGDDEIKKGATCTSAGEDRVAPRRMRRDEFTSNATGENRKEGTGSVSTWTIWRGEE